MKANLKPDAEQRSLRETALALVQSESSIYPSWQPSYVLKVVAASNRRELGAASTTIRAMSPPESVDALLSRRQRDVFNLLVQGMSNKEIARCLKLGEGTVKIHVAALFRKLGVSRRSAVAVAGTRFFSSSERSNDVWNPL